MCVRKYWSNTLLEFHGWNVIKTDNRNNMIIAYQKQIEGHYYKLSYCLEHKKKENKFILTVI